MRFALAKEERGDGREERSNEVINIYEMMVVVDDGLLFIIVVKVYVVIFFFF